jgi:hypothetical protein
MGSSDGRLRWLASGGVLNLGEFVAQQRTGSMTCRRAEEDTTPTPIPGAACNHVPAIGRPRPAQGTDNLSLGKGQGRMLRLQSSPPPLLRRAAPLGVAGTPAGLGDYRGASAAASPHHRHFPSPRAHYAPEGRVRGPPSAWPLPRLPAQDYRPKITGPRLPAQEYRPKNTGPRIPAHEYPHTNTGPLMAVVAAWAPKAIGTVA